MAGHDLEVRSIAGRDASLPHLIFLHEGIGSVSLWRDFPDDVARQTGAAATVYSRYGYGQSDVLAAPRAVDYMHDEALVVLPALLDALRVEQTLLIGHSDGGSIALIHAARHASVRGVAALAPHVFVEDISIAGIEAARVAFATTDLPEKLARHHRDPERTFHGWNDIWLAPEFRTWNIESFLPAIGCPVMVIQGEEDNYGTMAQLDAIERQVSGPCELVKLPHCGHSPHRDQPVATLAALKRFIQGIAA